MGNIDDAPCGLPFRGDHDRVASVMAPKSTRRPVQILPPQVAERIAAGEVIERPASVVKELVENALDAGATEIEVRLEDGGKKLIEVTDNGHGMGPEDLRTCIERHATSKLTELADLDRLRTLGFRGEALPSIAAVAELSLLSRTEGSKSTHPSNDSAYELVLRSFVSSDESQRAKPEPVTFGLFLQSETGTRIQVRGLFSQVPARLKFLKSNAAEAAQVREWLERLALTHPEVSFRLLSDTRTLLQLRAESETDRVRAILADADDLPIRSAVYPLEGSLFGEHSANESEKDGALRLRIHWLQGVSSPQTRKLVQVINGRAVRDRLLQQALLNPFRQALLPGQFPAVALFVEIDPSQLDVNVHPTKSEVRFLESSKVFRAIQSTVEHLIERVGAPAVIGGGDPNSASLSRSAFPTASPTGFPASAPSSLGSLGFSRAAQMAGFATGFRADPTTSSAGGPSTWHASEPERQSGWNFLSAPTVTIGSSPEPSQATTELPLADAPSSTRDAVSRDRAEQALLQALGVHVREVGILFRTYLAYETPEELILVDQHAADERVRYERLKARALRASSRTTQALLLPEAVRFAPEKREEVEKLLPLWTEVGFEAELFGEDTLLFRGIPADWGTSQLRARLKSLMERSLAWREETSESASFDPKSPEREKAVLKMDELLFETLASQACHSAVRAGDPLEPEEARALVHQLFLCDHPWNCPHGRPTVVRITRGRFEEWFQRRVPH